MASFLIPAYNEEKNLPVALKYLEKLDGNYEILVGVTGTDKTAEIAESYGAKVFYYGEEPTGKAFVINKLARKAKGDILIVHDADWIFKGERPFSDLLELFEDEEVGGIAESFAPQFNVDVLKYGSPIEIANAYMVKRLREVHGMPRPVNIIRKTLYKPAITVADDIERYFMIKESGKKVLIIKDPRLPRFFHRPQKWTIKKYYKLRLRGYLARRQLKIFNTNVGFGGLHILGGLWRASKKPYYLTLMIIQTITFLQSMLMPVSSTKELWRIRTR